MKQRESNQRIELQCVQKQSEVGGCEKVSEERDLDQRSKVEDEEDPSEGRKVELSFHSSLIPSPSPSCCSW